MITTVMQEQPDALDSLHLLKELDTILEQMPYPPESRHAFSVEKLKRENVAFFVARLDGFPAGCGGIQLFGTSYGEVKRMYVRPGFRGSGLGKLMLSQLEEYARSNHADVLRLETGIYQTDAIALYEKYGFRRCPPFGSYKVDPLSIYFEKSIG